MNKMIVAIGGGENGRQVDEKTLPYETELIDKEIIRLTNKKKANFLFINHAMPSLDIQESYYQTMKKIYGDKFGCNCLDLKTIELDNIEIVKEKISWADIIYEGGGDTEYMINLWKKTEFDKVLYKAYNEGKVICGISAGAVCWFNSCNSDSENGFEIVDCLKWFDAFITPHCDELGRYESTKKQLKVNNKVGILLSNKSAIEIVNNKYRIILNKINNDLNEPYVLKAFWKNGLYKEKKLIESENFIDLNDLINKE